MNTTKICACLIGAFTMTYGLILVAEQSAIAQTGNGWNYAIDSSNDGYYLLPSGETLIGKSSPFEFYGLAFKEDDNNIIIALNSNMPLTGVTDSRVKDDGVISWGDLFFNFSGNDFNAASANGSLYAIRFAGNNNSKASTLGVYQNVTATSVTSTNTGFQSLNNYQTRVEAVGGPVSYGDLPADTSYFDRTAPVLNVINTGSFVAGINWLDSAQLGNLGLDFSQYGATGSQTIAFSFDRTALPTGDFIASIFAECANDGIALRGKTEEIPEPLTILGSLAGIGYIWRRQRSQRIQSDLGDRT